MINGMPKVIVSMFLCCSTIALANLASFSEKKHGDDSYQRMAGTNRSKKRFMHKMSKSKKSSNKTSAA